MIGRLAFVTVAAVGLYVPTVGFTVNDSCTGTAGVAGAAPSPSCGGDLRECLRQSADIRQTTFGGRYVTAEDVARCMETFNACIHGGASTGGNGAPPASTSTGSAGNTLPQRFHIGYQTTNVDCQRDGNTASCRETHEEALPDGGQYVLSGDITGTVSGMTMTGSFKGHSTSSGHSTGCVSEQDHAGAVRYDFNPDGSVAMHLGPTTVHTVYTGECSNAPPMSDTYPVYEATGTWAAK